MLLKV